MLIAKRVLKSKRNGDSVDVTVSLHQPQRDGSSWLCRYEIDWPDGKRNSAAAGADSMQAIVLALQKIGTDLYMSESHIAGALMWDRLGAGYGFPLPSSGWEALVGDDRKFL